MQAAQRKEDQKKAKEKILGKKSTVQGLHIDDYLEKNPAVPRPRGSPRLLLETARNLRVVALRFAVDLIYSSLLSTAGGSSFSPLHPLMYLAQLLEESGLYPYWESLPATAAPRHPRNEFKKIQEDPMTPYHSL